ncbi:MAG: lamin tail domain-containing protein [Candidatus Thalassarchaeaceae archaeon]
MRNDPRNMKTAFFLVFLMLATPMLSLETSLLSETENSTKKFTSTKTATTIPDCDLSNVTITEVYHYSSDWIEIYNDGNQTCDLGEWRIGDSGSSFEIANNTNISANQHLVFTSSNSGLNFDISCNDQIFISTRNVDYVNATEITQLDCYGPNDNDYYNTNLDGSWELCDGFWDWNEPDEMTQNSTNLCNGNPFSFNSLSEDGTWDNNPSSIDNGSSTLSWNVSNLDENTEYQLYSSWNTGLNSFSRNYYFNGGIEDITFDMFSSIDWTCEVNIYAYLRNQSSSIIEEYFGKDFDVSNCPSTGFTFDFQGSTGIQNGHNFSAGIGSFTAKAIQISSDQEYIVEIKLNQDNIVTDSFTEECDYIIGTSNTQCQALGQNIFIYDETCDVEFSVMIYTKSPYGWIEIGSESIEGVGPCNSDSNDISEPIRLYANMTDSNGTYSYQVVDSGNSVLNTSTTNTHNFYWAFPTSSYGSEYRFYSYYDNDQVFDFQSFIIGEDTLSDYDNVPSIGDGTTFLHLLPWNATSSGGDCTPYIYSYLYLISPDGEQYHVDQWSQSMDLSDCTTTEVDILIDWNNSVSQDSWTTDTDSNDLLNGTNSMYLNISNLEVGQEYVLEWYSYRSSSYTNNDGSIYGEYHNTTTFTSSSENESIAWTIDVPGSWCDLDIYYTLYSPRVSQEWHTLEDEGRYDNIISSNYDFDPVCDGTDIPEYNPVSLMYNDSGTWIEVNESTNLSVGIYDMKWQVSGISDSANVRLYTTYEQYLNSSTQSYNYYKEGNFEENWELIISDWSCNIDFDFDLNLVLLHSGSQRDMDYSKNNPFIDGPCNTPIDVSSSNSNEPSYSISKLVENSTQNLDSGTGSLDEGENTIRWSIENTVDDYEHYLHMSLRYNNQIDEFIFENFLGDGGEISGDWSFELEGDVCDIQIYTELYVKEYNGMDSIDSSNYYLSYSGNSSDCDYQDNNIGFSVLDDSNTWNSSLETLSTGTNQMRFNMDFDYVEDVTYYISAYVDAPGSQQESWNGYFSIGQPTSSSSSWDDYFGEDIYLNFTVNAWSCSVTAYAYIYYITPTNSWQQFKRMNTVFDVEHCESAGEISVSSFVNNQWNDQLDNNYELETGQNDFYWNMTNLSLDENYQMYFYAYKDNIQIYNYVRDYWVADSTSESWHFPVNIESSVCNFYAYAYLYVLVDDSYSQVDYVSFHPQEPCLPDFDINFITDDSSSWLDAQTDVIPVGTTQMMFDLSELGEGDYEIDYYWNSDESYSNWDYDNYFTVDENNSGLFWNITLEALDCSVYLDVRLYDRSYGGNYQIGSYNNILLNGPCLIPFNLDVNGVEYDNQNGNPDLSLGDNDMTWTFDNLDTGINYYLSFYWYNGSNSYSENYYFTYNESNDYAWNLPIGVWDCSPYSYATLYYADNGSHIFGNEWFYFNVPECYNVWLDHTDSNGDYMNSDDLNNGSNDMSWDIYDLPEGYEFALEMRTYMNGYMQEYSYELFNDSGNVSIDFSIDVDTYSTCDVRAEASLLYLDYNGKWDHLEGNSKYFYLNCDSYESMYPWSVFVDADGDGNYSEVSQYDNIGGNGTISMMLDVSNLADDEIYRVQYRWYTSLDSEYFNWEDVTSTNNQFYFDVPVSNWDCEVRLYVYIQYETFQGYNNHMISTNQYFNTDCLEPGNVSLNMDNMGEVWDDWSNLNNGTNNMSWELSDLILNETYTIDWYVKYNNDIVSYEYLTWTTGDSNESISWSFDMDNSTTCNVEIMYRMFVDSGDSDWIEMDNEYFYWYPSCDQWVYPDDNYVNLYVDINGTMVENPDTLPSGEVDFEVHFENMSVGADYRMYFYYSNTGFNSNSQYIYFTYDGSPMEMTIDIAPWACSVYFSYDMRLYDFRYGDGNSYSDWYLGSDSTYIDGPCESLNYDSSNYPDFTITDDAGNDIDDETDFLEGNNTIILGADNLQNSFPYYMELQVRYDGYLNVFKTHSFTGNNTTMEEFHTIIDLPGHVCSVEVRSYLYVTTSSGSNQLNYTNYYADGPCDGSDGESRLDTPLHAYLNGTWVEVDDDTFFPAGETDMSWDLSGLDPDTYYYMDYNAPNTGWGGYFYGDNIPDQLDDWSIMLSEFRCDMHFYRNIYAISDYTGWNSMGSQYFYPDNDCLDGGDITLEIQDDEGNWSSYDSSSSYDLLPGTTNFSWSLDNLLEGYDYEFYWYQQGSEYRSEYQYFTADSTAQESIDFSITIDQYECNVYFYAYLRPMSDYTGNYEETEYFRFDPIEPCYPPFNFAAEDAAGNLTVDALDPDFVLSPGDNHLFFDFNHMDNGTTYYLDWYWSSQNSWNGWYQNYVYVDTTDNISDGLHFNMTLDSMECYAYVYVNVYNYSNGNSYHMGNYNIDLEGPCMVPFSLENYEDEPIVDIGENQFTWVIDNLDVGSNYTLQYYYSMNSGFYGWHNYDFTFNGTDFIDFTVNVTEWDCNVNFNANMYNTTNGSMTNLYGNNWNFYNPNCYEVDYYALDSDGDWIQYNDIDAGTTELFWEINYFNGNVPEGYEFELEYQIIIDNDWSNPAQYSVTWIQDDDTTEQLPWNITINDFVCNVYVSSNLHVNTSSGWSSVRGNGFSLYGPCESMPSGWYNFSMNDNGTWTDVHEGWNNMIEDEGDYEMRLELSDLEVGIWYEMSVKAFMYGNLLYDESLFWPVQDNSTVIIDINMSIPHWYCGITFETQLSFEHEEEMFEIMTREYYEEGPCHTNIQDFTESFDVNLELLLINDNLYSQDYEYVIPFTYNLNDNFKLYLDANYGNMDGILNESEAIMAEDAYNSNSLSVEEDAPEFYLNEELFESYRYNNPILSNLSGTPIVTGSWILEYFNIQGVEISTSITDIEIDDLVPWHFSLLESSDILVQSIEVNDSENGSYEQSTQFDLLAGNYSINITWLLANIPDPILELEQYDLVSEEFGELTDVMEDSFNETMTVHTFQISLTNLSYQEYLVAYDVNIDEYYNYNSSYDINREVSNDITTFSVSTDIHTCDVSISIEIYDRNEEHLLTQNYTLEGTCQPYDIDMDGISDEDDAFPYDPTEWLDTDGDGVGDNSDAFPNDPTEWLDSDGDGLGNNNDTDDDNDGIDDDLDNDGDGDGVNNEDDAFPDDPDEWNDTDGDGYGDNSDVFPNNSTEWEDTDGDGIGDNSDDDADGDGVPNDEDGLPLNPNESSDSDNDGIGNNQDAFPNDANEQYDTDSDGIGDNSDTDDDNDGVEDIADAFPLDPNESLDTDGDGAGDNSDVFPNDASEKLDSDGDGVGDNSDMFPSNTDEWSDTDGDGVGDNSDAFPIDSNEQLDSDGDGVGDNADAFPYDNNEQEDSDGDGVGDNADALPNDSGENADSDGDGVGDNSDAFPNDSSEDTDSDGDGVGDNSDEYPDDPFRTEAEADGGFLPGFSSIMGIISMLGAAIILTGRRKE